MPVVSPAREPRRVVSLPAAGAPADHGLASLGLLMQLAGSAGGAIAALVAAVSLLDAHGRHSHAGWWLVALALCFARGQLHRIAGRDLAFGRCDGEGRPVEPFGALRRYVAFAVGQSVVLGLIACTKLGMTEQTAVGLAVAFALWPIAMAIVMHWPRLRALSAGLPLAEDRGLEGASLLMTVLGVCGALTACALFVAVGAPSGHAAMQGFRVLLLVVLTLLLVRSCLHVRAGLAGLRVPVAPVLAPSALADSYASFGVVTAFCVGAVLALLVASRHLVPGTIACVAVACWMLVTWPMVIRRYFHHRQVPRGEPAQRRAPDAGLSSLGWLLAGHAAISAAGLVVGMTVRSVGAEAEIVRLIAVAAPFAGPQGAQLWLGVGTVVLEALAAIALVRLTDHRRAVATTYALITGAFAVHSVWPLFPFLVRYHGFDYRLAIVVVTATVQLVLPAMTLVLVHRTVTPGAQAHYRRRNALLR